MSDQDSGSGYAAYRETRFFGNLDGLRCLSIVLVMWHHSPALAALDAPAMILQRGFTGVNFFFVLSGYLITTLLLREEARFGRFSLTAFYRRRILRIVPVYFLVVTLMAIWWIGVRGQDEWWGLLPYYYLFLANFLIDDIPLLSPTWSLSAEEQYYLIWPLLLLLLPAAIRWRGAIVTVLIAVAVLMSAGVVEIPKLWPDTEHARFLLPVTSMSALLIGTLLGLALHDPRGFRALERLFGHPLSALVLLIALMLAWQTLPPILTGWPNLVMHLLMAALLAALVVREDTALSPLLRWRPVARIGAISYGIYLWHLVGRHVGVETAAALGLSGDAAAWVAMPVFVVASIVIAEISFRWFESFFLRLKASGGAPARAR